MHTEKYEEKVRLIRRYSSATAKRAKLTASVNEPLRVELYLDQEQHTFTLSGNEMASLLSEFPSVTSIDDLFK
jgi:hypothetical protein